MRRNKLINLIIALLLLSLVLGIPFSNVGSKILDEKQSLDDYKINIENIDLVTITDTSLIVTWTTNINSSTNIYYGLHPFLLSNHYSDKNQTNVSFHYLELNGLDPGISYFFRVSSNDKISRLFMFTTLSPPSGEYLFSFATISDKHVYLGDSDSLVLNKLLVSEINNRNVSFVIDKGDMGYPLSESKNITDGFLVKYYPVYGDNDFIESEKNVEEFLDTYEINSTYYSFDQNNYHFIVIDSISRFGFETGFISNEEFSWLKQDLEENIDKKIMIFMHHPSSVIDFPLIMGLNFFNGLRFRFLISRYDVVGVFSGHTHRNKITYSFMTKKVPYVETAPVHKYPAGYNIYNIYLNGFMQSFYKINSPITEKRRKGELEDLLSPLCGRFGFVWDRNFVHNF